MIDRPRDDFDYRIARLAELGASTHYAVGTRVLVEEDKAIYINIGQTTDVIVNAQGWSNRHVWMPIHVLLYIQKKHPAVTIPVLAASQIVLHPDYVYVDQQDLRNRIFVIDALILRDIGACASVSTRYVDAIIEPRPLADGVILRLFHLSPRNRLPNGAQTWP